MGKNGNYFKFSILSIILNHWSSKIVNSSIINNKIQHFQLTYVKLKIIM